MIFFLVLFSIILFVFWLNEFWTIVNMKDDDFPNRNDRLMWAVIVFFGNVLGAAIFAIWKVQYLGEKKHVRSLISDLLSYNIKKDESDQ